MGDAMRAELIACRAGAVVAAFLILAPSASAAEVFPVPWYLSQKGNSKSSFGIVAIGRGYCVGEPDQEIDHIKVVTKPKTARRPYLSSIVTVFVVRPDLADGSGVENGCADVGSFPILTRIKLKQPWHDQVIYDGFASPPRRVWPLPG